MKKMPLATALALLITGCAQQTFTVQNKPAAVVPKETITYHFHGIGQKKIRRCSQNLHGAEMKANRNPANIRKWIARFYYFRHSYPEARGYCSQYQDERSIDMGNSICSNCPLIYFPGFLPVVLHSDQPLEVR